MAEFECIWVKPSAIGSRLDGRYNSVEAVLARNRVDRYERVVSLREISKKISCGPFGSTLTASEHDPDGEVILVQPTDISSNKFSDSPRWKIPMQTLREKALPIYLPGTLMFARVGDPYCVVLPERATPATISSSMIAVILNKDIVDEYYVCAFFQSKTGQEIMKGIQKITAQPTVSTQELSSVKLPLPDIEIQKAIGRKLREAERLRDLVFNLTNEATENIEKALEEDFDFKSLLSGNIEDKNLFPNNSVL